MGLAPFGAGPSFAQSVTTFEAPSENLTRLQNRVYELDAMLRDATDRYERSQIQLREARAENERLKKLLDDALRQQQSSYTSEPSGPVDIIPPPAFERVSPPPPVRTSSATPQATGALGTLPAEAAPGDAAEAFRAAQRLLQQTRFAEAELALTNFLKYYSETPDAPEARYWLARTQVARGRHADAAANFVQLLQDHPKTPRAPDAWVRLGMVLRQMDKVTEACATFKDLPVRYPAASTEVVRLAQDNARQAGCPR
jgi:tol-pal system protein YbgF